MSGVDAQGRPFGRYVLGPRLAAGGMGEVFLGVQLGLGRFQKPLVLKLLLPHLSENEAAIRMFLDEAQLAGQMSHPNVVQVFDVGRHEDRYFIAMELVKGVSLSALIKSLASSDREMPADLIAHVGRLLCQGLEHAHELKSRDGAPLQVVHRDVTPQNVLVASTGDVKLADFGIAKAKDSSTRTAPGTVKGKFEYLAPEQIEERPVDHRADLYGAALTLFHLAALESPFRRDSEARTLQAVLHEPLPSLSELRPDLPPALVGAIEKGAAKSPDERFATAREFLQALPPSPEGAAARLGALVAETCRESLDRLEAQTAHASSLRLRTEADVLPPPEPAAARRRAPLLLLGAVLALPLAGGLVWLLSRPPAPAEPPVAAPVPGAVAVASQAPEAVAPPSPSPSATPAPAPTAPPAADLPAPSRPPRRAPGYLTVDAIPWASVFLDGKKIGDTPIDSHPAPAGPATLVLSNPQLGKRVTRKVTIRPGAPTLVKVDLR